MPVNDVPNTDAVTLPPVSPDTPESASPPSNAPPEIPEPRVRPIFYDEERRRWPWIVRFGMATLFVTLTALTLFVVSLFALRFMPATNLPKPVQKVDVGNPEPILGDRERRQLGVKQKKDRQRLSQLKEVADRRQAERLRKAAEFLRKNAPTVAPKAASSALVPAIAPPNAPPVVAGFYVSWDEVSRASFARNAGALTHFIPEWLHLKPAGTDFADPSPKTLPFLDARQWYDRQNVTLVARSHEIPIIPILNNFTRPKGQEEGRGIWDTAAVHQIIANPSARANVIARLRDWLIAEQMQGINIDFEEVAAEDRSNLTQFMKELYAALHPHGLLVTQDVQLESEAFDHAELAKWNDWLIPMFYDEHTGESEPGPVAGVDWTEHDLKALLRKVPAAKVVMAVGNHGYDWTEGQRGATEVVYQSAIMEAKESDPDAPITLDKKSLNPTFTYRDDQDKKHVVWMQDAVSIYNQLSVAKPYGIRGAALWYLGAEDPSIWSFLNKDRWQTDWGKLADAGALNSISYGGEAQVDFEGEGELLQPLSQPSVGHRSITRDPKTGLVVEAHYLSNPRTGDLQLPSSHVVRRYGGSDQNSQKKIILTFDDGPDPQWTPQILDILKRYHVPAVFFVVGRNAEANPDLLRRIWDEGHEIGDHSWSHPDLFRLSPEARKLQLTTTQRVIQAVTGHSTVLFRPPYGNDVEPETGREVSPLETAAELGYLTVGQKNDPQDWRVHEVLPGTEIEDPMRLRTAEEIAKSVIVNRNEGSIVLMHDAGGDRSRTIAALPQVITQLRALGYQFVSVAQFRGVSKDVLMPKVTGNDVLLVGADRYVFEVTYIIQRVLTTLFTLSILLGISRTLLFIALALIQRYREKRRVFPVGYTPTVSVVIAAYNEEKVIARTVQALLEGDYQQMEIIVVDDGSKDRTSEVVREAFINEPRVRLIRKVNGGKASALNRGIAAATGDILVSLDADTLFAPDTITRLVRHFANPKVGAVSGNVRVGNTHNLLTRWQALEYTTSQNFDRRGYDLLNCITVVPGAVGALRREAVNAVGGYTHETLAEDTDLTWKLRRAGWRIVNDNSAMAYTEAPESLRNLAKQRFRWAFGTLQCLWKHRGAMGRHGAFGLLAMPSLWLYQILFPAVSPFMDIAVAWSLFAGNFAHVAQFYLLMFGIEFVGAFIALRMDRGNLRLLPWLFFQRFVYRQLMYYVILKSLVAAVRGGAVGWNKFERTGTARIEGKAAS